MVLFCETWVNYNPLLNGVMYVYIQDVLNWGERQIKRKQGAIRNLVYILGVGPQWIIPLAQFTGLSNEREKDMFG